MTFPILVLVETEKDKDCLNLPKVKTTVIEIRHDMDYVTESKLEVYRRRYIQEELERPVTADGFIEYLIKHGISVVKHESYGNIVLA